jgi:hypothetical protein
MRLRARPTRLRSQPRPRREHPHSGRPRRSAQRRGQLTLNSQQLRPVRRPIPQRQLQQLRGTVPRRKHPTVPEGQRRRSLRERIHRPGCPRVQCGPSKARLPHHRRIQHPLLRRPTVQHRAPPPSSLTQLGLSQHMATQTLRWVRTQIQHRSLQGIRSTRRPCTSTGATSRWMACQRWRASNPSVLVAGRGSFLASQQVRRRQCISGYPILIRKHCRRKWLQWSSL